VSARGHGGTGGGRGPQPLVPAAGVAREYAALRPRIDAAIRRVLASGRLARGPAIRRFEAEWASYLGVRHAVLLGSGTAALQAALAAAGVGSGDEVVVPAFTFVATADAVLALDAVPVAVDVDPDTLLLDVRAALRAVGPRTRAVVPVHLFGQVHPESPALAAALRRRRVALVEDACQAHGASAPGWRPGRGSLAACHSFYPTKNLASCGEAGSVATDDDALAACVRALRDHGTTPDMPRRRCGVNLWPAEIEAAVLSVKLPFLEAWNRRRRALARRYDRVVAAHPAARPVTNRTGDGHAYHQYVVRVPHRDAVRERLARAGVETAVHYPWTLPEAPGLAGRVLLREPCPGAEAAAREVLSLPVHPWLTPAERRRCLEALDAALGEASAAG
jgi:dTDP-4-amino-4,6-dideoxygalactose transaminase